ncbi:hypothetical protein [Hydrogenovibrio thermophilus]|uniref:Uncharacterized protein n=1 Tax=Hydrogenovibrio thermophilus TaxID=265883 RepID=A0A410H5N9_9GAMM|nr:hypothetical protein [Hydrogenovibrio thermophilus]QAB16242.1 hypothetical protein EPV75_11500 [Hydrogenovibrio thermophilus]
MNHTDNVFYTDFKDNVELEHCLESGQPVYMIVENKPSQESIEELFRRYSTPYYYFDLSSLETFRPYLHQPLRDLNLDSMEMPMSPGIIIGNILDEVDEACRAKGRATVVLNGFFNTSHLIESSFVWQIRAFIQKHKYISYVFIGSNEYFDRFFQNSDEAFLQFAAPIRASS